MSLEQTAKLVMLIGLGLLAGAIAAAVMPSPGVTAWTCELSRVEVPGGWVYRFRDSIAFVPSGSAPEAIR